VQYIYRKGSNMDDQKLSQAYEQPRVVDYGDLQELTAACLGGSGGDSYGATVGGYSVGDSNPAVKCKSTP